MSIKDILPKKDKEKKPEYYWTLVIEPSWIQAGIWKIGEENAHILADSTPTAWSSDEDLVTASDTALSSAVKKLEEMDDEPSKTVFGVASSWVDNGEIKGDHLKKIKKICEELDLTPVGFVVVPEAIAHYIKSQEGSPLNALVLGVFDEKLELTIFKLGEIAGKEVISRSVSVVDDLSEGFARLKIKKLPSRFIIYDGKEGELEEVRQSLLKANWDSFPDLEILHTPKIEIMDSSEKVNAVSLAGASELSAVEKILPTTKGEEVVVKKGFDEEITPESENENIVEPEENISPEDFGFVIDKDVAQPKDEEVKTYVPEEPTFGKERPVSKPREEQEEVQLDESIEQKVDEIPKKVRKISFSGFGSFSNFFKRLLGRKILIIGISVFILLFVGGFAVWWNVPKASVTIYLKSQQLEEDFTIFVDSEVDGPDFSESVIPGEFTTKTIEGEKTAPATGVKVVGDKATGEVTIYNLRNSSITLESGTILNGPNGLDFSLDESVTVASSEGTASNKIPSTTQARITALDLGADYNLSSDTSFKVDDYPISELEAVNDESLSGGSSREISAVSEDDREALQKELEDELMGKAIAELKVEVDSSQLVVEDSTEQDEVDLSFSHSVGEEATTLKLNMSLEIRVLTIDKNALSDFAKELLEDKVPDGFVLRSEQIKSSFDYEGIENNRYVLDVGVDANLLPEIDSNEIKDKISGKYPFIAEEYLKEDIPGFVRAEIILDPSLPGRLKTLPHVSGNIEIEVASER